MPMENSVRNTGSKSLPLSGSALPAVHKTPVFHLPVPQTIHTYSSNLLHRNWQSFTESNASDMTLQTEARSREKRHFQRFRHAFPVPDQPEYRLHFSTGSGKSKRGGPLFQTRFFRFQPRFMRSLKNCSLSLESLFLSDSVIPALAFSAVSAAPFNHLDDIRRKHGRFEQIVKRAELHGASHKIKLIIAAPI